MAGTKPQQHHEGQFHRAQTPLGFGRKIRSAQLSFRKSKSDSRRFAATPPNGRPNRKTKVVSVTTKDFSLQGARHERPRFFRRPQGVAERPTKPRSLALTRSTVPQGRDRAQRRGRLAARRRRSRRRRPVLCSGRVITPHKWKSSMTNPAMTTIGYYRIAPNAPARSPPPARLQAHGCSTVHSDHCSPLGVIRPGLDAAIDQLGAGDVFVVTNLHALAGSMVDLLDVLARVAVRGASLVSLHEGLDTAADQQLAGFVAILQRFNQQRCDVLAGERLIAKRVGPPHKITDRSWAQVADRLDSQGDDRLTLTGAAEILSVSRSTIVRELRARRENGASPAS